MMSIQAIPWRLAIPAEVRCEYASGTQEAYYTDIEAYLYTERVFPDLFEKATLFYQPYKYIGLVKEAIISV